MRIYHSFFVLPLFISLATAAASVPDLHLKSQKFWEKNKKVYSRLENQRDIIVTVKTQKLSPKQSLLELQGIGIVSADCDHSYKLAKDLNNLGGISTFIKKVRFNKKTKKFYMKVEAFLFVAELNMDVDFVESSAQKIIKFRVYDGTFKGLLGNLIFKDYKRRKTEIQFLADFPYTELPFPKFFIEFGLEVVIQKIAVKMRSFLETHKGLLMGEKVGR